MEDGMTIDMGSGPYYETWEGVSAWEEAIAYMTDAAAVGAVEMNHDLWEAAQYHNNDLGATGGMGHESSNGDSMATRVQSFFTDPVAIGENIAYGTQQWGASAEAVVAGLLIDDGVESRGHRTNLMNPDWTRIGVALGEHSTYQSMTTMVFAAALAQ